MSYVLEMSKLQCCGAGTLLPGVRRKGCTCNPALLTVDLAPGRDRIIDS